MSLNTLNLKQKQGGRIIKQADRSSTFKFALQDANGSLINLNGQEADIRLFNPNIKKYWSTKANVKDAEVEFKLPGNVEENDYILEITVGGYVFPSDNDFIIEVVKGFKDLSDMETGLRYKQTIEEITQDYIERSDEKLKENLDGITDERVKIDKANAEILRNINDTGKNYINNINTNYANVKLEFDKNAQKRKEEFTTIADNNLNTFTTTSDEALKNLKKTGDSYINNLVINYNSAKTEFGKNASQKNTELENNYNTYLSSMENKLDDFNTNYQAKVTSINQKTSDAISLIGSKRDEVLKEVADAAKIKTDAYIGELKEKIDNKVDKVVGKNLSDNNFSNYYKDKLDDLDKTIENETINKVEKRDFKRQIQEIRDVIFDNNTKIYNNKVYEVESYIDGGSVKFKTKQIASALANDFLKVKVEGDKYRFRIKSTSSGTVLFYSLTDTDLRYAISVYPKSRFYEINFGKKVNEEMIFTSVSMPKDAVYVVKEEDYVS